MKKTPAGLFLYFTLLLVLISGILPAQTPANDDCAGALALCHGTTVNASTQNATTDFNVIPACLANPLDGVWFTTTIVNDTGSVHISFNNINAISGTPVLRASIFAALSCANPFNELLCDANINAGDSLSLSGLSAGTRLYVLVCGDTGTVPSVCDFSASASGGAITPTAKLDLLNPVCNYKAQISVTDVFLGEQPYQYSLNAGPPGSNAVFSGLNPGTYTVNIINALGCSISRQATISTDSLITYTAFSGAADCNLANGSIQLNNVSGGTGSFTYALNGGPETNNPAFNNLIAGTYQITISDGICDSTIVVFVSANSGIQSATGSSLMAACRGSDGRIFYPLNSIIGATAGITYTLVPPPGTAQTSVSGVFNNLSAGTYTIELRDNNGNGCVYVDKVTVIENSPPVLFVQSTANANCLGNSGSIKFIALGGTAPYQISLAGGETNSTGLFTSLVSGTYSATVIDANGCSANADGLIGFTPSETATDCSAGEDKTILIGESVALFPVVPPGSLISWTPSTDISDPSSGNPFVSPKTETKYNMFVTYPNGCFCIDEVVVKVNKYITPINVFTPNQDGVNDVWQILNTSRFENIVVDVFDRWGSKIFHSDGYESGQEWDGTFNGLPLPVAVYYYVIKYNFSGDEKNYYHSGTVTIVK
ncbi:MAG: gliding motility-associated C-terminal domain-containing protein [Bacteroidota bacterium]|jgi:gliding motility-associated-like protein